MDFVASKAPTKILPLNTYVTTGPVEIVGCSSFGRTSFSQGKNESPFYKKVVINKKC